MIGAGRRLPWRHRLTLRLRITLLTAAVVAATADSADGPRQEAGERTFAMSEAR